MKCSNGIRHRPYIRPMQPSDVPFICRLAPSDFSITLEWLDLGNGTAHTLFYRVRGTEEWNQTAATTNEMTLNGLACDTEYELFMESEVGKRSNVRLARTGAIPTGTSVINYLHPEDEQYLSSGRFLCSPSLARTGTGRLIAGMDVFGPAMGQNLTLLFFSDDDGQSWHYLCDLFPFYWSNLFFHQNALYIMGLTTEYGNLQISRSLDNGVTWENPTTIQYGTNVLCATGGVCREPMHLTEYNGRFYTSIGFGAWKAGGHNPAVLSIAADADPMVAENWSISDYLPFGGKWQEDAGVKGDTIEGNLVKAPDGALYNYMRWKKGELLKLRVNTEDLDAPLEYGAIEAAPTSNSMFRIIPHKDGYLFVSNRMSNVQMEFSRNALALFETKDLKEYHLVRDIINFEDQNPRKFGFQYPSFVKEENTLYLSIRSAFNNADSFHNSNYILFTKIEL